MHRAFTLAVPGLLLLGACNESAVQPSAAPGRPVIEVRDAFIVQPPAGRDITGGGMHISVQGGAVTLISAASPVAEVVELHTMSMQDGMMQMRKVESFPVTEDAPLVLERGGNHLMLFGVKPLEAGSTVDVTLTFTDDAGTDVQVVTEAEVVPPGG